MKYLILIILILLMLIQQVVTAGVIDKIKMRGELRVGVKTDYRPWGGIGKDGNHFGMEVDLGRDLAERLGVKFVPVSVSSLSRLQKLNMKEIDLVIATMAGTYKRSKLAHLIEPPYYISGVSLLLKNGSKIEKWEDLKDCRICLLRGAFYNRDLIEKYSIKKQIYGSTRDIESALMDGQCIGWAYDDTVLKTLLLEKKWDSYKIALPPKYVKPWVMAVNKEYKDSDYAEFLTETVIDWHRTGFLLEREKYYGLTSSLFLKEQNKLFNKREGEMYLCDLSDKNQLPDECVTYKIKSEEEILPENSLIKFFKKKGMDFSFLQEQYNRDLLLEGIFNTVLLSAGSIIIAVLIGLFVAVIRCARSGVINMTITGISETFRLTPPLLHLYIIFFGVGGYLKAHLNLSLNAWVVAVICFAIYAGAAISGIMESAVLDYRRKNSDSRLTIQVIKAFDASYENIQSNLVNLVKLAGIASVISVPEIISTSNMIVAENGNQFLIMNFLLLFYLFFVGLFILIFKKFKKVVRTWTQSF